MFLRRSGGLMRSALKGSNSTLKNFASAAPIAWGFTWNSSTRMSSTFLFLRRAALVASSSSPAAITLSITRYSNLERDRERLRELHHALVVQRREGLAREAVDELQDAHQLAARVAAQDRRDEHLLGAVAGALVDRLQEGEVRRELLQLRVVVHVADVHVPLVQGAEARERGFRDRELDVLERIEAGLHLGNDGAPVLAR